MRRVFVGCLSVTLAVAVARAPSQEVQWRSASPGAQNQQGSGFASDRLSTGSGPSPLLRPQAAVPASPIAGVTPVTYQQVPPPGQAEQLPQPMPLGPGGVMPDRGANSKALTMPAPNGPSDLWGGPVAPWSSVPAPHANGAVVPMPGGGTYLNGTPFGGDFCGDPCGDCCGVCGIPGRRDNRWWVNAEYLLWTIKGQPLPPLVTTSANPFGDLPPGALGQPGTILLFGDSRVSSQAFSGARIGGGYWFDRCETWGVDTSFFILGRQTSDFVAGSNGFPTLFRPFVSTGPLGLSPLNNAEIVAFPGLLSGLVQVHAASELWGYDTNLRRNLIRSCNARLDLLAGYRYLDLEESLQIRESLTALVPLTGTTAGDRIMVTDRFGTRNQFNGGQVGVDGEWFFNRFSLGGFVKVALGNMHETVSINGNTIFTPVGGVSATLPGGLLAQGSNIGTFHENRFAVVPEVGFKVGYRITDWCRAYVGYNFLYLSDVMRPGDQIDPRVNINQLPRLSQVSTLPIPPPSVPFRHSDFWAQGVNFGFQFTW
jgi:hypothetical protein